MSIDLYPTILDATRSTGDASHNKNVDGRSIVPQLRDPNSQMDRSLFWHYPHYHAGGDGPYSAIRKGDWRLIQFHEGGLELYHLKTDIAEKKNVADDQKKRTARLLQQLADWRKRVKAQMPTANPKFDPKRATQVRKRTR